MTTFVQVGVAVAATTAARAEEAAPAEPRSMVAVTASIGFPQADDLPDTSFGDDDPFHVAAGAEALVLEAGISGTF